MLVLETEWVTPDGTVRVTDFMPPRSHAVDVVRIVPGVSGAVPVRSTLRLRFDHGRVVGLLSEEWDPATGRQLGNTPQAFSHFSLVTSGLQLQAGRAHRSDETIAHEQG